jgi:hypothetical protein
LLLLLLLMLLMLMLQGKACKSSRGAQGEPP